MRKISPSLLLLLLCMASACQVFPDNSQSTSPVPGVAWISPSPPIPASPTATTTNTPTASPTATLTPSPHPTATATIQVTPSAQQIEVFEQLWKTIKDNYLYAGMNGVDWDAVHIEYRQKVESGLTIEAFTHTMNEMIALLGDDHSVYLSAQEVREEDARFAGNNDYVGIGVLMSAVPERDTAVILTTFRDSPAEEAGLRSRDNILKVDGEPILDEDGFIKDVVRGPEGSSMVLTVQSPGQEPRQVSLNRRQISGPTPVPFQLLMTPSGKRIGYILLVTLNDSTIGDQVNRAISELSAEAPLDGLIIDNRQNSGGADTELRSVLGLLTSGTLGTFVSRTGERPLVVDGRDVSGSQDIPLAVLVGPGTVSYGEVLSGVLQDIGRGYLIGETTEGNVESLWAYNFEDGSRAWLAQESFRPLNHPGQNWEQTGIVPDLVVPFQWDQSTIDTDPAILSGLEYFDGMP